MYSLHDILRDPTHVAHVPLQAIPVLLYQLAGLQSALLTRLLTDATPLTIQAADPDGLLDVAEAAQRLGTSKDWLYRHADQLPFTVRLGPRQLRFSAHGLAQYLRKRQGR
jgi:predicted DNA-binding transcriptional regulator AlpA